MRIRTVSDTFTRPANTTAYADNDLVANSATAGSVVPLRFHLGFGGGLITSIRITKSDETDVANASFSLSLYEVLPTNTNGDNAAINYDDALLATLDIGVMVARTDNAESQLKLGDTGFPNPLVTSKTQVWGLLEANAAYAPASGEVFTVYVTYIGE